MDEMSVLEEKMGVGGAAVLVVMTLGEAADVEAASLGLAALTGTVFDNMGGTRTTGRPGSEVVAGNVDIRLNRSVPVLVVIVPRGVPPDMFCMDCCDVTIMCLPSAVWTSWGKVVTGRWIVLRMGVPLAEPGVGTKCIGETGTAKIVGIFIFSSLLFVECLNYKSKCGNIFR
jgi:hypothetical protein